MSAYGLRKSFELGYAAGYGSACLEIVEALGTLSEEQKERIIALGVRKTMEGKE